ncbi:MAG: DUF47 family protein [Clostridia bacterium]|nr:DUF47 family protein [Clostridia bacterium]
MFKKKTDVHALIMEQIDDVKKCLVLFDGFMRAATTPGVNHETLCSLRDGVSEAENVADTSLRTMICSLNKSYYLPSTMESLIAIATSCDKIANKCESIANLIVIYKFQFTAESYKEFNKIYDIINKQFELLEEAISMLFSNMSQLQKDPSILDEIRALESEIDAIEMQLSERIFNMNAELAFKMQFFDLVRSLCDVSDIIEDIADKIQIMLISRKA